VVDVTSAQVREFQRVAIVQFLLEQDFTGEVLDYGCGAAPYREIVETMGGHWNGYNRAIYPGGPQIDVGPNHPLEEEWDVILCTQMLQYVPDPIDLLHHFHASTKKLVLTYATNWPEVEPEDLFRFTRCGMERVLSEWKILDHRVLGSIPFGDREFIALGYGVVATP
jgi:hypothetical protein